MSAAAPRKSKCEIRERPTSSGGAFSNLSVNLSIAIRPETVEPLRNVTRCSAVGGVGADRGDLGRVHFELAVHRAEVAGNVGGGEVEPLAAPQHDHRAGGGDLLRACGEIRNNAVRKLSLSGWKTCSEPFSSLSFSGSPSLPPITCPSVSTIWT